MLFAATADSELWMWRIPSGESKIFMGHGERAETAVLIPARGRACVGYGDGSVRVFDLKSGSVEHNLTGFHGASVTALDARGDAVATGGVDGMARTVNSASGKALGRFKVEEPKGKKEEGPSPAA